MLFPIGIQTFAEIRENGFVYVDKTDLIYQLASTGKYYFLSRPRRFGKSLLVSTLESYFDGQKDLFQGLAMEKLEKDWKKHPIFHIDFAGGDFSLEGRLEQEIEDYLCDWEKLYGKNENENSTTRRFIGLLRRASEQYNARAVVLIDEYDKPLLDVLNQGITPEGIAHYANLLDQHRRQLRNFYGALKSADRYLRYVFLTGVTKFSQVSIFSGLNQLEDITFDESYAALCGITEDELTDLFPEPLAKLADKYKVSVPEMIERLKIQFDGYRFSTSKQTVYNPFSLLRTLKSSTIHNYWFSTGTPTYLMQLMAKKDINIEEIISKVYDKSQFADYIGDTPQPVPMLYQSGYLTIKSYNMDDNVYSLDFPNREVRRAFLLAQFNRSFKEPSESPITWSNQMARLLVDNQLDEFLNRFKSFLTSIPYDAHPSTKTQEASELHFEYTFYIILRLIENDHCRTRVEERQALGRVDCVIETPLYVYILEFKLDQSLDKAMRQIEAKNYAAPYACDKRKIYKIAVNFSSQTRTIEKWRIEEGK